MITALQLTIGILIGFTLPLGGLGFEDELYWILLIGLNLILGIICFIARAINND